MSGVGLFASPYFSLKYIVIEWRGAPTRDIYMPFLEKENSLTKRIHSILSLPFFLLLWDRSGIRLKE
jgi:hypothetical protein